MHIRIIRQENSLEVKRWDRWVLRNIICLQKFWQTSKLEEGVKTGHHHLMKFPEFINEFQPSLPEEETLDHRTWFQLGRAIQGLDVKGTEKIDSNAFQICKELKTVIDKKGHS